MALNYSETDTPEMGDLILSAFKAWWGTSPEPSHFHAEFEDGRWWIADSVSGEHWSVRDVSGPDAGRFRGTIDGFDFEQSQGEGK